MFASLDDIPNRYAFQLLKKEASLNEISLLKYLLDMQMQRKETGTSGDKKNRNYYENGTYTGNQCENFT